MKAGKRVGRPSKAPRKGARNSLGLRVTAETKSRLEAAAAASGRSQSQEVEFRLEQSFRKEDDGIAALGGSEQHALFRMMAAAAVIIENRSGKSWSSDWKTSVAVRKAWDELVAAVLPKPPREIVDPRHKPAPVPPVRPERPSPLEDNPLRGELRAYVQPLSVEQEAQYATALANYKKELVEFETASAKHQKDMEASARQIDDLAGIGKKAAELALPEKTDEE
ncbi:MAG: TraY domain-containing protein [Rhodospirillales bacterium]|nr:TraY domain-containing protein [Rhodospirillales bacterium]MDP6773954.1 TraY domain-containing protein [Rhodospirillales bacterium]